MSCLSDCWSIQMEDWERFKLYSWVDDYNQSIICRLILLLYNPFSRQLPVLSCLFMPPTSSTWSCMGSHVTLRIMFQSLHTDPPNSSVWCASETKDSETHTCRSSTKTPTKSTTSPLTHISNDTIHIIINQLTNFSIVSHSPLVFLLLKQFAITIVGAAGEFRTIIGLEPAFVHLSGLQQRGPWYVERLRENWGSAMQWIWSCFGLYLIVRLRKINIHDDCARLTGCAFGL